MLRPQDLPVDPQPDKANMRVDVLRPQIERRIQQIHDRLPTLTEIVWFLNSHYLTHYTSLFAGITVSTTYCRYVAKIFGPKQ